MDLKDLPTMITERPQMLETLLGLDSPVGFASKQEEMRNVKHQIVPSHFLQECLQALMVGEPPTGTLLPEGSQPDVPRCRPV